MNEDKVKVSKISGKKKRTNVEGTGGYPPSDVYMQPTQ